MRFYDVNQGSIKVDGTDINDITRTSLQKKYTVWCFRKHGLKTEQYLENIVMGKPDATKEEMIEAAKATSCPQFY